MAWTPDSERLLRDLAPTVLGDLVRRCRDFGAAEDAVQEALLAASQQWPAQGLPDNPRAWLRTVASRRLADHIRTEIARRNRENLVAMETGYAMPVPSDEDDTLVLLFLCCHPALTPTSAVALTLRAVGGLTTAEIARAFLVPESTMAQRISRAKRTIQSSGVPFELPSPRERAERLHSVLSVLYLVFNEGYVSSSGEGFQRADLGREAIRLARLLRASLPANEEVCGLLALMLLTDARRDARCGPNSERVPLDGQDRSLWDRGMIAEGLEILNAVLPRGNPGPYQLQAAVAALHDEAATFPETDWPQILALYDRLLAVAPSPVVELNRAVAVGMVHGALAGLAALREIEAQGDLAGYHRLEAVRGHLQEMAGDRESAVRDYLAAAAKTPSVEERQYLLARASRLRQDVVGPPHGW